MQEYKLTDTIRNQTKFAIGIFLAFTVLGLALFFTTLMSPSGEADANGTLGLSVVCALFFTTLAIFAWRSLRKYDYADLVSDDEGLWYKHLGKERGLISWGKITRIRERPSYQRLDFLDANDRELIRAEYQLEGFEGLRDVAYEKIVIPHANLSARTFKKGPFYFAASFTGLVALAYLAVVSGKSGSPILGYVFMGSLTAFGIYTFLHSIIGLNILDDSLEFVYPFYRDTLPFSEIENIKISDSYVKNNRVSEIWIELKETEDPVTLPRLGVDLHTLSTILKATALTQPHTAIRFK